MILDKNAALERIEQDYELYDEICCIFRDDVPRIIAELKSAYAGNDIHTATRHAHSIKSAAANIGATNLSKIARSTENALRDGNLDSVLPLLTELDLNMSLVLEALE
jgi:HPt (histidine-containing phosphotransfer) domain-containing protein